MTVTHVSAPAATDLYVEVQQFYGHQMQLLDSGRVEEWAGTFTEDGVFAANAHPEPSVGRENIRNAARRAVEDLAARKLVRRHWLGMLDVERVDDDTARVRSYAQILETPLGGQATLRLSTTCDDVLVRVEGQWLVRERKVVRDDL